MKRRCFKKDMEYYKDYGGRGITVCEEWKNDYLSFRKWAFENGYKEGLSIDRIDNDGDYEPKNCRWADQKTQIRNRRNTLRLEINGQMLTIGEIAEKYDKNKNTLKSRYRRGLRGAELIK